MNAFQYLCSMRPRGRKMTAGMMNEAEYAKQAAFNSYTDVKKTPMETDASWMGHVS